MQDLRLSMVSMTSEVGKIDTNTEKILRIIDDNSDSDIICFPEISVNGYTMPGSTDYAISEDDSRLVRIMEKTAEYSNCVCIGFCETGPYATQILFEDGCIVGKYRKTHLGEKEAECLLRADELPVFHTKKAVVGIQLCWESHFPEITCTYALKGADIVLMPHASGLSGDRRRVLWNKVLPARAYDNTVFVGACNQYSPGSDHFVGGGATIFDARGDCLGEDYSGECTVSADLDSELLSRIRRKMYDCMKDIYYVNRRRPEIYFK